MKTNKLLTTLAIVSVVLLAGCNEDALWLNDPAAPADPNLIPVQTTVLATMPLGVAGDFAILASNITVSGTNAADVAPTVTGGGFINVVNNGAHVAVTETGTGTINIVNNGGVLTATNNGNGVMTINSTATGAVTVTNTGNGRVNVTATGLAPITLTHTGDADFTYPSEVTAVNVLPVTLGVAGNFAILSKTGITNVYKSTITGDVGTSPITGAALLVTCAEVTGTIYTVDAAGPLPCRVTNASRLTTAVLDMQAAYTDAAGRTNPDFLNLGAGSIGGKTLTPGLYKWTSAVVIPTNVTISGGPNDVWIFQVAGTLTMSSAVKIILAGGAQAKNIFWQAAGAVTFGTTSHFEGNILGQTGINLQTGASINGRMLAQTAVTLQMNTITRPQ